MGAIAREKKDMLAKNRLLGREEGAVAGMRLAGWRPLKIVIIMWILASKARFVAIVKNCDCTIR